MLPEEDVVRPEEDVARPDEAAVSLHRFPNWMLECSLTLDL